MIPKFILIALTCMTVVACSHSTSPSGSGASGYPHLAGNPTFSIATASPGQTITVSVPVTSDTRSVTIWMGTDFPNPTYPVNSYFYGAGNAATNGTSPVIVSVKLPDSFDKTDPGGFVPGKYYPYIQVTSADTTVFTGYQYTPYFSSTNYTYYEGGSGTDGKLSSFVMPIIDIE